MVNLERKSPHMQKILVPEKISQLEYRVKDLQYLTENILRVFLEPKSSVLHYQAGQYLEILYPNNTFQPFSIANAPVNENYLELHVRHLIDDQLTAAMIDEMQKNKTIIIRGPYGNAVYQKNPSNPVLVLAGGTGFAYAKAIIEAAIAENDERFFHLYWGVKTPDDFYLADLPLLWQTKLKNFRYTPLISQPLKNISWSDNVGYIQQLVLRDYPDLTMFQIYASGPLAMVKNAYEIFCQNGLRPELMYSDML